MKAALEEFVKDKDSSDLLVATTNSSIGSVYWGKEIYSKALIYYERALRIWETTLGTEHPDTASAYNIGSVFFMRQYPKALWYFEKALAIAKTVLGDKHPSTKMTQDWVDATPKAIARYD